VFRGLNPQAKRRRVVCSPPALSEVLFLTGICKSFIDRSVKYGRNFLSSKRIQAGAKKDSCHMKDNPTVLPVDAWFQFYPASGFRSWNNRAIANVNIRKDFQNFA